MTENNRFWDGGRVFLESFSISIKQCFHGDPSQARKNNNTILPRRQLECSKPITKTVTREKKKMEKRPGKNIAEWSPYVSQHSITPPWPQRSRLHVNSKPKTITSPTLSLLLLLPHLFTSTNSYPAVISQTPFEFPFNPSPPLPVPPIPSPHPFPLHFLPRINTQSTPNGQKRSLRRVLRPRTRRLQHLVSPPLSLSLSTYPHLNAEVRHNWAADSSVLGNREETNQQVNRWPGARYHGYTAAEGGTRAAERDYEAYIRSERFNGEESDEDKDEGDGEGEGEGRG